MPAPLHLVGQTFGRLTVLSAAPNKKGYWLCHCQCGRNEAIHQRQLTWNGRKTRVECIVCIRGPCVVCDGPIELSGTRMMNTCSDDCKATKKRGLFRAHYYRTVERDPEHNQKTWQARAQRMAADPEYADRMRGYWATQSAKKRADPEYQQRQRAWYRAHYQLHKEQIQASRKARLAALSDEERAVVDEAARLRNREWRRQWREELSQDPERKAAYAESLREWRREAALRRMMAKSLDMMNLLEVQPDERNDDDH